MYASFLPYIELWLNTIRVKGFAIPDLYGQVSEVEPDHSCFDEVMKEFIDRMQGNYPFHQPEYAGQMLKPPHPFAWLAYTLAMTINPNNHALDGGPPSSEMEKEVISWIAEMVGYSTGYLGHLTSGGTVANLEALWVARSLHPDKMVICSEDAHYTHHRMAQVLGMKCESVPVDHSGKMILSRLEEKLKNTGTLIVTMGTTGRGLVDTLHKYIPLCKKFGVRIHVDAAYGGFFKIISDELLNTDDWNCLHQADSIVIDPHKHGLQPYGCGCVLFKDASVGRFYKHDSPYTYFSSSDLHLGEISLECSRAGASAAALWFTLKVMGLNKASDLGKTLLKCVQAAKSFSANIHKSQNFNLLSEPETDIICYYPIAQSTNEISRSSNKIFQFGMNQSDKPFYVSLFKINSDLLQALHPDIHINTPTTTILRSVFMKPSHHAFTDELMERLHKAYSAISEGQ